MPNEYGYERAAGEFRALAETLGGQAIWTPLEPSKAFIAPGAIADTIDDHVRAAVDFIWRASEELRRLARICDERSDICRTYRGEVQWYWERSPADRATLTSPTPPYPWVEL